MMRNRLMECVGTAIVVLLLSAGSATAQDSKFQSVQETGGAPGRYRVEIELRPGDDLIAISDQLAATYGARIEPYAEEGFTGFAIMATPVRARLMSNDPRVIAIVDLATSEFRETPVAPAAQTVQRTPTTVASQHAQRRVATESTVPGFGVYTYDGSGNITSIDDHVFRYDAYARLQKAVLGTLITQTYKYDRYGNILEILTNGNSVARMSVDPATNQIDLPFDPATNANMIAQYDASGNLVSHQQNQFVYDALNLVKETTDTARRIHLYTASDERVAVITVQNNVETSSEWTLRDAGNRVLRRLTKDTAGAWHWKEDYIYAGPRLLAAEVTGPERVRHFHLDHLGTPRLITGNGGVQIATKTYQPFGLKASSTTPDFEQLEFTGHERDLPTLDYMHARYYKPDLGRFLSVDPVLGTPGNPQSWNRYTYVRNSPIGSSDPTGKVTNCDAKNCTTTADTYNPAHSTGQTTVATPEMRAAAETDGVAKAAVSNGTRESLGYGVRDANGNLTVEMAVTSQGNTTSNSSGATATTKVPTGAEFAIHGHIDGGPKHSNGMVDGPELNKGYGDTVSLALQNPIPMATVSHGQVGWHEIQNGQLSFTAPVGALNKAQQQAIQSNLNSEQKLKAFWKP